MSERRKPSKPAHRAEVLLWSILGMAVTGLAFGGWATRDYVSNKLASREDVLVASAKAEFVLDQQMAAVIAQISYLERKQFKSPSELQQLQYLRGQLEIMRKVRAGR